MNVHLGSYMIPMAISIVAMGLVEWRAWVRDRRSHPERGHGGLTDAFLDGLNCAGALIVSLFAWFIWALLT